MGSTDFRLFATDLDGTLLGEAAAAARFKRVWEAQPEGKRPLLCYSSGRLLEDVQEQIANGLLPQPDYIIGGVGTAVYDVAHGRLLKQFTEVLEEGWDRETVEKVLHNIDLPLEKQPKHFQNAFKSSWFLDDATPEQLDQLQAALEETGVETHLVYSSRRHLDILPKWANKGNALRWLLHHLQIPHDAVLVAGDSGNDSAMFRLKGVRGIVPGNAQPELLAEVAGMPLYIGPPGEVCAQAVLAGLKHFGVLAVADEYEV
ncbi:MAG: HAD-IIB family hydrolase [Anaerolineae bacterium]|nr:HAD-IIB family hydrolase [Anaerolineae bacterium]